MNRVILLIFLNLLFSCGQDNTDGGVATGTASISFNSIDGSCAYTLSAPEAGAFGSFTSSYDNDGYIKTRTFSCSEGPTVVGKPEISINIYLEKFVGAGTYELKGRGSDGLFLVKDSQDNIYRSLNSSNCKATFTSNTQFTFSCENLVDDSGMNYINVSNGTFLRVDS